MRRQRRTKRTKRSEESPFLMEFEGIPFQVIRRRVKYSRVEFRHDGEPLRVIVPRGVDPLRVLQENRDVILKKYQKLLVQVETAADLPMAERAEEDFHDLVYDFIQVYSRKLGVRVKEIKYRKMKRRWGSCRSDGRITFNRCLQFVPDRLVGYIVYHEMAHILVRGHGRNFKEIIAREFPHYRQLDKELNLYGLRLLAT